MFYEVAVYAVVVFHYVVTLLFSLGVFAVMRWPRLMWLHLAFVLWILLKLYVTHWPCPLTDLEKELRHRAGLPVYETHFVDHYFYRPLGSYGPHIFDTFNTVCLGGGYTWIYLTRSRSRRRRVP